VEVNRNKWRMIGEGDDKGCMQAKVGSTIGQEATTAATRLYHGQATLAVTRGVTIVDKRWQDHRKEIVVVVATADKNLQGWLTERRSGDERWWQETVEGRGVVMMVAADNNGNGGRQRQWPRTATDNEGMQDQAADYNGEETLVAKEIVEAGVDAK
jgi:hypothetical protein